MHERGVRVGLRHGVAVAYLLELIVILGELVAALLQFLYLLLFFPACFLLLLVLGLGLCGYGGLQLLDERSQLFGSNIGFSALGSLLLNDDLVNLLEQNA